MSPPFSKEELAEIGGEFVFLFSAEGNSDLVPSYFICPELHYRPTDVESDLRAQKLQEFGSSLRVGKKTYMNTPKVTMQSTDVRACVGILECLARKTSDEFQTLTESFRTALFPLQHSDDDSDASYINMTCGDVLNILFGFVKDSRSKRGNNYYGCKKTNAIAKMKPEYTMFACLFFDFFFLSYVRPIISTDICEGKGIGLAYTRLGASCKRGTHLCTAHTVDTSILNTSVSDQHCVGIMGALYASNHGDTLHPNNCKAIQLTSTDELHLLYGFPRDSDGLFMEVQPTIHWLEKTGARVVEGEEVLWHYEDPTPPEVISVKKKRNILRAEPVDRPKRMRKEAGGV
jgi:hypothetical protein